MHSWCQSPDVHIPDACFPDTHVPDARAQDVVGITTWLGTSYNNAKPV
jgi:hypothetical protein